MTGCVLFFTSPHQGLLWWGVGAEGARLEEDTYMTKHSDAPFASGVENDVLAAPSLISAGQCELVVLRALGRHTRMAKTIRRATDGRLLVEPHDGRRVYLVAHARTLNLSDIMQAGRGLAVIAGDEFVVRGAIRVTANPRRMRRLLHARPATPATMAEVPRRYVLFDIDGACVPIPFNPRNQMIEEEGPPDDPASFVPWEAAIEEFIREALPSSFHGVSCWWQFTAGMGFKSGLHMRLLFILDRPLLRCELERWIGPGMRQHKLDPAVFRAVQQILVAPPILPDGTTDPLRFRAGWLTGHKHVVSPPDPTETKAMPNAKPQRQALSQRAKRIVGIEGEAGSSQLGFEQRLALIGDGPGKHGFHNAILSAVGSWMRAHPDITDTTAMEAALVKAIMQAPRDDALHPVGYVMEQIAAVPGMVADVGKMEQAANAARAFLIQHEVDPPHELPSRSADAAAGDAHDAISTFLARLPALLQIRDAFWRDAQAEFGEGYPERGLWCQRAAVLVGAGIGKSEAAIAEVIAQPARNHQYRIAYVVPEHKLADDVCRRFNRAAHRTIAKVWRGISQPDPVDPSFTMCRRPADSNLVQLAGGDIGSLCGSSRRGSLCPHHPEAGGACAYLRQRQADPQIWIVPAAMLTKAVPAVMQRKAVKFQVGGRAYAAHPPAFDLLVLDEAPFLGFLGGFDGDGFHVPLEWLDPAQWEVPLRDAEEPGFVATTVDGALRFARQVIERLHQGTPALRPEDDIDFHSFETAAEFECHPDERVEAIRWLICEAEVQQAIGRVRGVRRKADDPVLVIVLNGVDLGQTPIHQLISWEDLLELCGPVSQMAVRGIVPKLWADVAAVCAPRWSEAQDPGHAAKLWFSRHPDEKAKLARVWRTNEFLLPWSARPIPLRPVSLGLSGKHHRRVWLAADTTLEAARDALGSTRTA